MTGWRRGNQYHLLQFNLLLQNRKWACNCVKKLKWVLTANNFQIPRTSKLRWERVARKRRGLLFGKNVMIFRKWSDSCSRQRFKRPPLSFTAAMSLAPMAPTIDLDLKISLRTMEQRQDWSSIITTKKILSKPKLGICLCIVMCAHDKHMSTQWHVPWIDRAQIWILEETLTIFRSWHANGSKIIWRG